MDKYFLKPKIWGGYTHYILYLDWFNIYAPDFIEGYVHQLNIDTDAIYTIIADGKHLEADIMLCAIMDERGCVYLVNKCDLCKINMEVIPDGVL